MAPADHHRETGWVVNFSAPSVPHSDHTTTPATSLASRISWACADSITRGAALALSTCRDVKRLPLSDDECEQRGLPFGTTEPAVFVFPMTGLPWWRLRAWDDGEGCFQLHILGHAAEVHHLPKGRGSVGAAR